MPICRQKKIIFIHVPRCGGNYIEKNLKIKNTDHETVCWYKKNYPNEFKTYQKIIVVRHPLDIFISNFFFFKLILKYNTNLLNKYPIKLIKNLGRNKKINVNLNNNLKLKKTFKKKNFSIKFNLSINNIININSFVDLCYRQFINKKNFIIPTQSSYLFEKGNHNKIFDTNIKVFKFEQYPDVLKFLNIPNNKKINSTIKTFSYNDKLTFSSIKKLCIIYKLDFINFKYQLNKEDNFNNNTFFYT